MENARTPNYGSISGQRSSTWTAPGPRARPLPPVTTDDYSRSHLHQDPNDLNFDNVEFPSNWIPMYSKTVIGVPVDMGSEEAVEVHKLFVCPREWLQPESRYVFNIKRITRIQNARLWGHYYRQKQHMNMQNGGRGVAEFKLFHGTRSGQVDNICRRGFEVGRAGIAHSRLTERGIYFARESCQAHHYTECEDRATLIPPQIYTKPLRTFSLISSLELSSGSEGEPIHLKAENHQRGEASRGGGRRGGGGGRGGGEEKKNASGSVSSSSALVDSAEDIDDKKKEEEEEKKTKTPLNPEPLDVIKTHVAKSFLSAGKATGEPIKISAGVGGAKTDGASTAGSSQRSDTTRSSRRDKPQTAASSSRAGAERDTVTTIDESAGGARARRSSLPSSRLGRDRTCRHFVIMSSVLVGASAPGRTHYVIPPPLDPADPTGRRYDSCFGCRPDYLEFVVFRNNQAYPEYLIEYTQESTQIRCQGNRNVPRNPALTYVPDRANLSFRTPYVPFRARVPDPVPVPTSNVPQNCHVPLLSKVILIFALFLLMLFALGIGLGHVLLY